MVISSKKFVTDYASRNILSDIITINDINPSYENYDLGSNKTILNVRFKFNRGDILSSGSNRDIVILRAYNSSNTLSYSVYYRVDTNTIYYDDGVAHGTVCSNGWNVIEIQNNSSGNDIFWLNDIVIFTAASSNLNIRYIKYGAISISSNISNSYYLDELVFSNSKIGMIPFLPNAIFAVPKISQNFSVYNTYIPTKASVYLKPVCNDVSKAFNVDIINGDFISGGASIDALNFYNISEVNDSFLIPSDNDTNFSSDSKGFLQIITEFNTVDYPTINYPIQSSITGSYNVWIRCQCFTGSFSADIYIDGILENTIQNYTLSGVSWNWFSSVINIPDKDVHTLGIRLHSKGSSLNKIVLSKNFFIPVSSGPKITKTPFQTIFGQLYTVGNDGLPNLPLFIYDYKNTLLDIKQDDWYNFSLEFLKSYGEINFDSKYAFVLFSVGGENNRYILWETALSNEYICETSAIKY